MKSLAPSTLLFVLTTGLMFGSDDGSFEKSVTVSGPVDLDVQTDSGGITIRQGPAGTVSVHAILKADHGWFGAGDAAARMKELEQNPPVEQTGNRVRIGYVREGLLRNISMQLEIETPTETQVHAKADSGGIRVESLRGPVDCKTDSGSIVIHDISANVRAAADSGGIHAQSINGSLFARVDSGGIEARGIAGSMDAQTDSGGVKLEQTIAAPISVKAESGGVTVRLAPGAGYDVRADSKSGRVTVPEMTVHSGFSSHHIDGKIAGGGPLVQIQVDSGSVTIN